MLPNNFCIFVLSHGRSDNMKTLKTLEKQGYTGKYYIVIDNEDKTSDNYYKLYGKDKVIMFDKLEIEKNFDAFNNFGERKTAFYARNACFQLAKKMKIKYFIQLDDDYTKFTLRFTKQGEFKQILQNNSLDFLFLSMLKFYKKCKNITCLAISQSGDFIGGNSGNNVYANYITLTRKAMNVMLCSIDRKFAFVGSTNEDVNTYVSLGQTGQLFFTITNVSMTQTPTQTSKGGLTDIYVKYGTYLKSFYTLMVSPSCVKLSYMGAIEKRIHHKINWKNAVPEIIDSKYKKVN